MNTKTRNRLTFLIYALLLGAFVGALTWLFLWAMDFMIELIWVDLPEKINWFYLPIVICMAGGVIVGLCKKYFGSVPGVLSIELEEIKKTKRVNYKNLPAVAFSSFIPLIFGGSIGPEAALVSILGGLSTWIADHIKSTAKNVKTFTEIGAAAALSAMFGSPFFGFAETFEEKKKSYFSAGDVKDESAEAQLVKRECLTEIKDETSEQNTAQNSDDVLSKRAKNLIYIAAALAAFGIFAVLSLQFPSGGIYRYEYTPYGLNEWMALLPLALVSSAVGYLYYLSGMVIRKGICSIKQKKVLLAVLGGFVLGLVSLFLPYTLFSGEAQIAQIQAEWMTLSTTVLLLTVVFKIFVSRLCFLTGWRGGHIFPIIFSGLVLGYGLSRFMPVDPTFCALICSAALTCMVLRKPAATVLVYLVICPFEYLIPLSIAALISIFMPFPKIFEKAEEEEILEELEEKKRLAAKNA